MKLEEEDLLELTEGMDKVPTAPRQRGIYGRKNALKIQKPATEPKDLVFRVSIPLPRVISP